MYHDEDIVTPEYDGDHQHRKMGLVAFATVFIGAAFAAFIIVRFRPPEPVVVKTPEPPPQVVYKYVETPAPPPQIIREEPRIVEADPPPPIKVVSGWAGVWRKGKDALPIFQVKDGIGAVSGTCIPTWNSISPMRNLEAKPDYLQCVVEDGIVRTHFRLIRTTENKCKLEQWITENDWVESFKRANMVSKTPQLALMYRKILDDNAYLRGTHVAAGTYYRSAADAGADDSEWATPPPGVNPNTLRPGSVPGRR